MFLPNILIYNNKPHSLNNTVVQVLLSDILKVILVFINQKLLSKKQCGPGKSSKVIANFEGHLKIQIFKGNYVAKLEFPKR